MGRPKLPIGTYSDHIAVSVEQRANGRTRYRAKARYRGSDGVTRTVVRYGDTKGRARDALKVHLAALAQGMSGGTVTPQTTIAALADLWLETNDGKWRPQTHDHYRYAVEGHIKPRLAGVTIAEIRASTVDQTIRAIHAAKGPSAAGAAKRCLSGMFRLAVVNDAMTGNPALGITPISAERGAPEALTRDQEDDLRDRLRADPRACELDLPDFVEWMLFTGCRLGEACAARTVALDPAAGTWEVNALVTWAKSRGLFLQERTKTDAGWRVLALPPPAVAMLDRRDAEVRLRAPGGFLFGSPHRKRMRNPSQTARELREVLDAAGYPWVHSHTFRKTVATRLDEAGMSARVIADQLGHSKPSVTQDVYLGRRVVSAEAARVLDR